ncbi:hypothetical protein, partial [Escherichia coli]|uniref:hypothetical protein n=1 Tax=Escherichia coli TaxID=562 RepID=UPI0032ED6C53
MTGARTGVNGQCTGSDDHSVLELYGRGNGQRGGYNWKTLAPGTVCRLPAKT